MEHADNRNLVGGLIDFADDKVRQPYHDSFVSSAGPANTPQVRPNSTAIGRTADASDNLGCCSRMPFLE